MKKLQYILLLLTAFSCTQQKPDTSQMASDQTIIYTTNYPLYFMTEYMAPERVSVRFPTQGTGDPAHWQPHGDSIVAMQQADLIIINGASYEQWLTTVSLPESKLVNTSAGFLDRLIDTEEVITHSHGDGGEHQHTGTAFTTWLDLELAVEQTAAIRKALLSLLPGQQEFIQTRYEALHSGLTDLNNQFKQINQNISKSVVYSHPVYQYFQRAYQLPGPSLHWEPDQNITDDQLHQLEHLQDHHAIEILIWEAPPLPASITAIEKMGIKSIVVNPMGNIPEQGDFLEGLQRNLDQIQQFSVVSPQ